MDQISALGLDVKFRQRWEFRDGRSELSSDNSLSDNNNKPQECDSPASQLPSPKDDVGKDSPSSLMAKKACKSRGSVTRKVKSAKKKRPDLMNFKGTAGVFDISISDELQVHMRSVLEDLDAERQRLSTWMREEMEKMSANGGVPRGRGKNGVPSRMRKSEGRSKSVGPNEINFGQLPGEDGNNVRKQKAADPMFNISHDSGSASIPHDVRNNFIRPDGPGNLRIDEQCLMYYSHSNGNLNYSATIPTCSASPIISNSSNCGVAGIRPTNPGVTNIAATQPFTSTYRPIPLLVEGGVPPARGQLMENFWSNLTNSMVGRFE